MRFLKTNTATRITVGPFLDKTDGITPETALTVTSEKLTLVVDTGGVPTLVLDTAPTASGGANDMVHITNDDAGFYDLELAAADVNYVGRAMLSLNDVATHCPVFHEFMILSAQAFDAMCGTGNFNADAKMINGVSTGSVTTVNANIGTTQPINHTGTGASADVKATLDSETVTLANGAHGGAAATITLQTPVKSDVDTIKTQSVTCAAGVTVLASVGTAATSTAQTGDSFARLGAAGAGLTAVPWNASWDAEVQSEVDDALVAQRLDELLNADSDIDGAAPPTVGSVVHEMLSKTAGSFTYDQTTDSLEAIRDKETDIETDTADIQTRLPAALDTGRMVCKAEVVGDKTGYSLTQAFPANFADLAVTAATGRVTVGTNADKTGYSISGTKQTLDALNDLSAATVRTQADDALVAVNLDHLVGTATGIPAVPAGTYLDQIMDDGTAVYDRTTDSLQAIRDRGDAAWGGAGSSDWTSGEKEQIRSALGIDGTKTTATGGQVQDIQGRLPAALVSGRIDASVGAMAANVVTAAAINADAITAAKVASDVSDEIAAKILVTPAQMIVTDVNGFVTANVNGDLTATMKTSVQTAADAALVGQNLDHLVKAAVDTDFPTTVHLNSVIGQLADNGTAATFDRTTDSLEAIRDRGDSAWGGAGSADWTTDERNQIRKALGVTGTTAATEATGELQVVKSKTDNLPADPASVTNQTTILNRLGAFTGTGINSVLGFFRALLRKDAALTPTDVGGTFDNTTDALEALKDNQLDAAVSSRAAAATALTNATWTDAKAGFLDVAVTSRAAAATALTNATWTDAKAGFIDIAISSRLATAGYTAPPSAASIVTAAWDELTATARVAGSYGQLLKDNLDAAISSRHASGAAVASVSGSVGSIASGGILSASFAAGAVDSTALADNAITAAKIATGAVTASKFAAGAVDAAALATDAITEIWSAASRTLTDKAGFSLAADQSAVTIGTVNALGTTAKADVRTELRAGLGTNTSDVIAELAVATPATTPSPAAAIMLLYMALRNKFHSDADIIKIHNDAGNVICKAVVSDDGTTYLQQKLQAGP